MEEATLMRVSAKGQLTIPVSIRRKMDLKEGDYMRFIVINDEILLKKVEPVCPLGSEDPFWKMVGIGKSGAHDGSINHDHYLAEGECKRWKK